MKLKSVLWEAARNVRSNATRSLGWATAFLILVGGVAVLDARSLAAAVADSVEFRDAGAAVQILEAPGNIDPDRCDALAEITGVRSSGAVRDAGTLTSSTLPSNSFNSFETTIGFYAVLGVRGDTYDPAASSELAAALGISGGSLTLSNGQTIPKVDTFNYPADGRSQLLGSALVQPVPPVGNFDQCWAEVWPENPEILNYALFALADASDSDVTQRQLNSTLGTSARSIEILEGRPTRSAPFVAAALGAVLALVSVRSRRLQLASARHSGVSAPSLSLQFSLESLFWGVGGALLSSVLLWFLSYDLAGLETFNIWTYAWAILGAGVSAVWLSSLVGVLLVRESHLFKYFKER